MHRSRLAALVIDCCTNELGKEAEFWGAALGHKTYRRDEQPGDENYIKMQMPDNQPAILLQKVTHPSRVHLDIESDDIEAEVERLERIGAKRVEKVRDWWVMQAPSGHRFCVVKPQRADFAQAANVWDDG